jgi:hypothetical protein
MRRWFGLLLVVLGLGVPALTAVAQTPVPGLELKISKIDGFSLGGRVQGRFQLAASGPAGLQSVTFLVDGSPIGVVTASPFRITFDTGSYELGRHDLSAVGTSSSGETLQSDILTLEFVSPDAARRSTLQIVVPILAIVVVVTAVVSLSPLLGTGRRRRGIGEYGLAGGAVCRRCGLPFSRHIISLGVFGKRLERCPHCGKLSFVGRATREQLAEAEARQRGQQTQAPAPSEDEDSFRRLIDDSRFDE